MTTTITAPTLNQTIKSGRVPYQTIFTAVLSTKLDTAARFLLDGIQIGFVKIPLKRVATPTGEAFLYGLIVTIPTEGSHLLRVENLDTTTTPVGVIREFANTPFSLAIDQNLTVVQGSKLIAALKAEADPLPQYLTPDEANALYRSAGLLTPTDIPVTQATDAEVSTAITNLKTESDAQYRKTLTPLTTSDIPAAQATDAEVSAAVTSLKAEADPLPQYRKTSTPLTPTDVPVTQATDAEVSAAIANLRAEADPLPQYRKTLTPLTPTDIPTTQATDAEVASAIANYNKAITFTLNGPLTFVANEWNTLGVPQGFSLGKQGETSAWLVGFNFQYSSLPEQQYCGAGILSFTFGKVNPETEGTRLLINAYSQADFYLYVKATSAQGTARVLQIKPEININIPGGGKLDIVFKSLI